MVKDITKKTLDLDLGSQRTCVVIFMSIGTKINFFKNRKDFFLGVTP